MSSGDFPPPPRQKSNLIWLQILVGVILLLVVLALLFPATNEGGTISRRAVAGHDVQNIVAANKSYVTEYGRYVDFTPSSPEHDGICGDPVFAPGHPNSEIFNTLRAIPEGRNANHQLNPRRVPFFEGPNVSSSRGHKAGFAPKGSGAQVEGSYLDPWGRQYGIVLDSNYDNRIDVGALYTDFAGEYTPRVGVGAFALGKDGKLGAGGDRKIRNASGEKADDVVSWQ